MVVFFFMFHTDRLWTVKLACITRLNRMAKIIWTNQTVELKSEVQ